MVEDYVYVGRRRHWARTLIYGVLTLGVYGRILLYKQVKEIDGHRALFIDLRVIAFLLFLPILGPLAVKIKLRRLLVETLVHDITQPPVRTGILLLLAFVPIIPGFQMQVQHRLNRYWRRQRKVEDVKHMRADLEKLKAERKTDDVKRRIGELEGRIGRHAKALEDEEEAARAIREAEAERRAAERELKEARRGPIRRMMARLKVASARRGSAKPDEDGDAGRKKSPSKKDTKAKADEDADAGRSGGFARAKEAWRRRREARAERKAEKKAAKEKAKSAKAKEKSSKKAAKRDKKDASKDADDA